MCSKLFWFEAVKPSISPREREREEEEDSAILAESDMVAWGQTQHKNGLDCCNLRKLNRTEPKQVRRVRADARNGVSSFTPRQSYLLMLEG